jgi:hypothetical protein
LRCGCIKSKFLLATKVLRKGRRVDFNTGTGGTGDSGDSPREPGGSPPPRTSGVTAGAEFRYTDPVQTFISTVQGVVLQPANFFRGILRQGDFLNPLIFAIICYEVSAVLGGIIAVALGDRGFGGLILNIILAPIGTAIGLFIGAGIFHLLVMVIVGSRNAGFEGTFRVGAYLAVVQLVSWLSAIPVLGVLVGILVFFYSIFLGIVGIREVHTTTTGKAALVVLIPVVVIGGLLVLIVGAALLAVFAGSR